MLKLKEKREAAGLTQARLAEISGIGIRTIQAYECGARDINDAKVTTVIRLADAIGVSVNDIVETAR